MRRRRIGWPKSPSIGYKNSEPLRHRHPCDLIEAIVHNPKQVEQLDPTKHVVRISHSVGERKRVMIVDSAKAHNLKVLNPRITRTTEPSEPESDDLGVPESDKESAPSNKNESEKGI
jgi:ribosomal protein L32E